MAAAQADSETYRELEKRWRTTSKLLFGAEVGALSDYAAWLSERADTVHYSKSSVSGNEVAFSLGEYCAASRRISFDEVDFGSKPKPLPLGELKDIDSLIGSLQERFAYAGNMVLGNSKFVEKSSNISDSFYVYASSRVGDSKYIAYTSMARLCDNVFGAAAPGESSYLIRCNDTYHVKRAFELWMTANCTDCYYVFALNNCTDCMFSFNLRGVRHAIGNVPLPREKYLSIKSQLLEQMRDELVRKKRLPSLTGLAAKAADRSSEARELLSGKLPAPAKEKTSMAPMGQAFSRTAKILFGAELSGLESYRPWLLRRIPEGYWRKSAISGGRLFIGNYAKYSEIPEGRVVLEEEALKLVELTPPADVAKITMDTAHKFLSDIAYFSLEYHDGTNSNIVDCMAYAYSSNVCQAAPCVQIKDSAYDMWPRSTEHAFGCGVLFDSQFCMHCYQSVKLQRCFECDSCRDCADSYFCHNCENVQNGIFCFNAKNLRYAVGNVEVGREKFLEVKTRLQEYIGARLGKEKKLELDIFNLACRKR